MTKISALTPLGDGLAVGDQFIIRDIDDAGTPNKSVTISGITRGLEVGTALAPSIAFAADKNTGIYGTGSDVLALVTAGENRLHITAGGLVGIGTSTPAAQSQLHVVGSGYQPLYLNTTAAGGGGATFFRSDAQALYVGTAGSSWLTGSSTADGLIRSEANLIFAIGNSEKARIDSSGRLLVGTSTARTTYDGSSLTPQVQVEGTTGGTSHLALCRNAASTAGPALVLGKTRQTAAGQAINTAVLSGDILGTIQFEGADGTDFVTAASISAVADAEFNTSGDTTDGPGRLVFSTTPDGSASPTPRMRIHSTGSVTFQSSDTAPAVNNGVGASINAASQYQGTVDDGAAMVLNRRTSDGTVLAFRQDSVQEGDISISGTTVSYNGAHLSRWSQLPGGATREEILRGTVLSNLDEMCGWGDEDNEQLNRMQVSDIEGDKNVSGVFQAWDDDDDTYTDDFYCAMTGDFIIRIAEGVTVERGDLLMSAGDGTAKPQDDDIIRSKTIAKVTSTHVTCTYDDGSYCVPCVLMAC